jgi:hypothetical protein
MPRVTRATAEREAAFLEESLGAESLSSPPATPLAGNGCEFWNQVMELITNLIDQTRMDNQPFSKSRLRKA